MPLTFKARIIALLQSIDNGKYPAGLLNNLQELRSCVKEDTKSATEDEGMAMLGYLLKKDYVTIDEKRGIILSEDDDTSLILREMMRNSK